MKGTFSLNRVDSNDNSLSVRFRLRDLTGGKCVIEVTMTMEDFAALMLGLSEMPCEYTASNLETIGKRRETAPVPMVFDEYPTHEDIAKEAEKFKADGWELLSPSKQQRINAKPLGKNGNITGYSVAVTLVRFVEAQS